MPDLSIYTNIFFLEKGIVKWLLFFFKKIALASSSVLCMEYFYITIIT